MKIKEIILSKQSIEFNSEIIYKNDIVIILDKKDYEQIPVKSNENYFKLKFIPGGIHYQKWDDEFEQPLYSFIHVGYK